MREDREHRSVLVGGEKPPGFKKLKPRHYSMIAMHCTGKFSNIEIARRLGVTAQLVGLVLRDPLAQQEINNYLSGVECETRALLPLYNAAMRDGLQAGNQEVRLRAADMWHKHTRGEGEKPGVQVNVAFVNSVRERFINELKEAHANA